MQDFAWPVLEDQVDMFQQLCDAVQLHQDQHQSLRNLQPLALCQEPSETRLPWQVPIGPARRPSQSSQIGFWPGSFMQSAMQHAFGATEATSDQRSDHSAAKYTSSTGYSHSPPVSPRGKRPCSVRAVVAVRTTPSQRSESQVAAGDDAVDLDSPAVDTPDKQRDLSTRDRGDNAVRERAASGLYGLRRLKASPRWTTEAAQLSDDSRSAGVRLALRNIA